LSSFFPFGLMLASPLLQGQGWDIGEQDLNILTELFHFLTFVVQFMLILP